MIYTSTPITRLCGALAKVRKLILVTAKHLPQHRYFTKIAEELSKRLGCDLEIREEDYEFLSIHGDKDEFGMAWAPQLFVELDDGSIRLILSKLPIDAKTLKIDTNSALNEAISKLRSLGIEV